MTFLRSIADRFTPTPSSTATKARPDGFLTAKGIDALFPRTNPVLDGEDCLHDCDSCTAHLPRGFKIDEEDALYGHINGWSRHLIVATGKTDWVRDVCDEKGSVMEAVGKHDDAVTGGKLMLSASNMMLPDHNSGPYGADRPTRVLLMPAFQFVDGVTPNLVPGLIKSVINSAPTNTSPLPSTTSSSAQKQQNGNAHPPKPSRIHPSDLPAGMNLHNCPHKAVILMCSQATRDARCGQSAPLLRREFERHLRPLGLYRDAMDERPGGVGIYFISHVGGHKYSANIMVYRRAERKRDVEGQMANGAEDETEAAQCIWLARVRPEDCENIVRYTVLQGKVVKPDRQLRGGFDREKGVVSW
ncbi:Sucrase/ferredoxin-like-domain-containing protein [Neohortaea acidophila]|uniref:Sucrase/ferredoxin-like-domain-containing protein n=1 Tax=Neohortaea acidophila TaxID=245834 RepID=A0A6A6PGV0_9PEZI|nr:Sucrase/ferredoxin-like-domain-containing protein [Neohortaea acidophila]KAF2479210.1 Sucrase/ferredoxin-like-domain-containing protein [Neohortaea acidophila]